MIGLATTAVTVALIGRLTLWPGPGGFPQAFEWCVVCGSYGSADFALNLVLFVPLGFGLRLAGMPRRYAWLTVIAATTLIEALQFYVVPGRESDFSDIIANSLGGVLGVALADLRRPLFLPNRRTARGLAVIGATTWCICAALVQWGLTPSLPHSIYYEQVAPDLGMFDVYQGAVIDPTFDGAPFRIGRLSADSSERMRSSLVLGLAHILVATTPAPGPERLAPIVSVFDQHRHEIFLFGRRHDDLVFRLRRRVADYGLRSPSLLLPLGPETPAGDHTSDTTRLSAEVRPGWNEMSAIHARAARSVQEKRGVWEGWRFFIPDTGPYASIAEFLTAAWVIVLCFPMEYWSARAAQVPEGPSGRGPSGPRLIRYAGPLIVLDLVALALGLAIIPWTAAAPVAPLRIWAIAAGTSALAWGLALLLDDE